MFANLLPHQALQYVEIEVRYPTEPSFQSRILKLDNYKGPHFGVRVVMCDHCASTNTFPPTDPGQSPGEIAYPNSSRKAEKFNYKYLKKYLKEICQFYLENTMKLIEDNAPVSKLLSKVA